MLKKSIHVALVAAVMLLAWSVAAPALGVSVSTNGGRTEEYSSWRGIRVFDTNCDNNDVYSDYKRDSGTPQVLRNSQGCNSSEESGESSNLIQRFNHCTDDFGPNTCSSAVSRR